MTAPADPTPTPAPDAADTGAGRPLAALMRELAAASADGKVTVHAETVMAWADAIEERDVMLKKVAPMLLQSSNMYLDYMPYSYSWRYGRYIAAKIAQLAGYIGIRQEALDEALEYTPPADAP